MSPSTQLSLLTAIRAREHVHLILGTNPLAATRCGQSLAVGANPIVIAPDNDNVHYTLQKRIDTGETKWLKKSFDEQDLFTLGREEVGKVVDAVFVTSSPRDPENAKLSAICQRNRIPINVVDSPNLSTFTLLSAYTDGPLQIGVTTNGKGCKLASRIRREIASSLPPSLGAACTRLGEARKRIHQEDHLAHAALTNPEVVEFDVDDTIDQSSSFNKLVLEEGAAAAHLDAAKTRRIRWLSQVCEYWPLKRLAEINDDDVSAVLAAYTSSIPTIPKSPSPSPRLGKLILAGSGPGHPDLLTRATHKAILSADIVLADKLVPSGVMDLIPRRTTVHIARKFPGNADAAQDELLSLAQAGIEAGKTVLRLKQGDPYIYGRGGEEYSYFASRNLGHLVAVLPGVTSALSAPLFATIPATQRDVADQVLICTGTGKKGKPPVPPEYVASRTVVFLMALHRIEGLVKELTELLPSELEEEEDGASGKNKKTAMTRQLYPISTPCAVIERASCPDQRVIRTTLKHVQEAIEAEGSRPPGLLVVGKACEALVAMEKGRMWAIEEGFRGVDLGDELKL